MHFRTSSDPIVGPVQDYCCLVLLRWRVLIPYRPRQHVEVAIG
jgi:hypothetical protein